MRAPVQKKRSRDKDGRTGNQSDASAPTPEAAARPARKARVRNRLIIAVAVVAAAVAGAGVPSVVAASGQATDAQELVEFSELTQQAVTLSHSLADERDEVTAYIAAGRPEGSGLSEKRSSRVDRQIEEIREGAPHTLRETLDTIGSVRRQALTGKGDALDAHNAYATAIDELHGTAQELVAKLPTRSGPGRLALTDLDRAVEQATATRGLLLAALAVPSSTSQTGIDPATGLPVQTQAGTAEETRTRDALSAAAQQAQVAERAALAAFERGASPENKASYRNTVSGPEVTTAEKYLARLTGAPTLSEEDAALKPAKVDAALTARIEQMRGVENALAAARTGQLAEQRDEDVLALEIQIGLVGLCLLLAVGMSMGMARSLTRPLAVLRLGTARLAADPAGEEPLKFTGRNDEFAEVVRSVNALHAHLAGLHERLTGLETDRKHLVGERVSMAEERDALRKELAASTAHLERARQSIHGTFVNLALRSLGLVERQLTVIENLEDSEQDPDRLATLFKLDHFATVMRRHSENLLVLAGAEHGHSHAGPVPLVDVARAAVSETERYERIRISALPPHAHLAGFAADDLSHLLAELMENATSFSPPDAQVEVSGWLLESGEVMLSVQDEGIGMSEERLAELNKRLARVGTDGLYEPDGDGGLGLGLYVVARIAARHGIRVQLRTQQQGGVTSVVVLPKSILAAAPSGTLPASADASGGSAPVQLAGADAEANSNVLPAPRRDTPDEDTPDEDTPARGTTDRVIAAAERAVRARDEAEARAEAGQAAPGEENDEAAAPAEDEPARSTGEEPGAPTRDTPAGSTGDEAAPVATDAGAGPRDTAAPQGEESGEADADAGPDADAAPAEAKAQASPETTMELYLPSPRREQPAQDLADAADEAGQDEREAGGRTAAEEPREAAGPAVPGPYAIGPDAHERTPDEAAAPSDSVPAPRPALDQQPAEPAERVTDKGLPKRTPKLTAPAAAPKKRAGGVDAEKLRRRLGGFHSGAQAGRRDVEAEIAEQPDLAGPTGEAQGDSAEEARS
ncbi:MULTISPECIES: sensor histidine kinase [Streptomyces diastaticus group]|uniref:Signal transduction histidine-protein kinase/phosphatase MprB n=2 Tax=Streptomyces TaxID=1883 RepID=A0A8H9HHD0_9ACTN|nr:MULTISPECIES: nitrate- and nitrite sensing domain-containing protein [Streptomyces diastaticus group]RPK85913.1 Adaptive-response sensory-kinase SasA [Streptomyces sp. ADI98-12]SUO95114.1 Two component sensor histidine kinase [Streptomyces griseus]GFH67620.1 histidine kinase [Streptomyces rutgersensis]GFH76893.1 histidine kinase [Streptomyces gougerotii]GGU65594.1 histidine kinase [Streptomyces gougerotii]